MRTPPVYRLGLTLVGCLWASVSAFGGERLERANSGAASSLQVHVPYVPTSQDTVEALLNLAEVSTRDTVYDLGCGDGRIVITAASRYGARGLCVELDPQKVQEARARVRALNLDGRVQIIEADLFTVDIKPASVVVVYLSEEMNLKLRPALLANLKPGSRIVSHHFAMGDWKPERTLQHGDDTVYLWRVPSARSMSE